MRIKRDYMGHDQLLPAYNMQVAVCDEYIATVDVKQYASDMDCFIPLMEKFNYQYGRYAKYPVAYAGYGSFNNYIYCESKGMEKFMKFTMFEKETKDEKYRNNPYKSTNFKNNERSIQAEGTYGIIKWDKSYKRLQRRGLNSVLLEFILISCGFNLYKYHNKKNKLEKCA